MEGAHCPWEQQKSQFIPFGMLLQGTSTGEWARRAPWNVKTRSHTATMIRPPTVLFSLGLLTFASAAATIAV
jgi:hypothetical protein